MADKQDNLPFQVGRLCGSTVTILQGVIEIVDAGQRIQLGLLISPENVAIGGAVAVSGVAEGVHGAMVAAKGMAGWVESTSHILKMAKGKGGGGDTYPGETPNMIRGNPNPLSNGEIKILEKANYDAHDLKI